MAFGRTHERSNQPAVADVALHELHAKLERRVLKKAGSTQPIPIGLLVDLLGRQAAPRAYAPGIRRKLLIRVPSAEHRVDCVVHPRLHPARALLVAEP